VKFDLSHGYSAEHRNAKAERYDEWRTNVEWARAGSREAQCWLALLEAQDMAETAARVWERIMKRLGEIE
jgi:hypothetical protein